MQTELYSLFTSDPEASFQRMVDIAAEKGVTLTVDEVKGFLKQMDEDMSLTILSWTVPSTAIAGGQRGSYGNCCQEEAHDEPWRRCPGIRLTRTWTF